MYCKFLPYETRLNPYQSRLAQALSTHGVEVSAPGSYPLMDAFRSRLKGKLDLIHFHWTSPYLLSNHRGISLLKTSLFILACTALKISGVKLVWTVHNLTSHEGHNRSLEIFANRFLCRIYDQIIVHCPTAIDLVIDTYRLPANMRAKISAIPHGHFIDEYENTISREAARQRLGVPSGARFFLYFGQIRAYKNLPKLVETFRRMDDHGSHLLIAGSPSSETMRAQVLEMIASHPRIQTHLEFLPSDEIQTYLNAADIVVLPFVNILTSSTVTLAMSFVRPVITPSLGCSRELLSQQNQLLYNPDEADGLLNRMLSCWSHDLVGIGQKNLDKVNRFSWERVGGETYEIYQRCF